MREMLLDDTANIDQTILNISEAGRERPNVEDDVLVAVMLQKVLGWGYRRIAKVLGVSKSSVCRMLEKAEE
jgi:DNA-directed RNA polymerase specialized sigma24 family protein